MPVAPLRVPLTKAEQLALRNRYMHEEAEAARAARSQPAAANAPSVMARRKVIHTKTGLE